MDIVLEGPDNSGKSTLADFLHQRFPSKLLVKSEGPEKHHNEINERVARYMMNGNAHLPGVIYDRHPCVSQSIYGRLAANTSIYGELIADFYRSNPLFIYCRPAMGRGLQGHIEKAHDSPEHLAAVKANWQTLLTAYDEWALRKAVVIYRIGDNMNTVHNIIREIESGRNTEG